LRLVPLRSITWRALSERNRGARRNMQKNKSIRAFCIGDIALGYRSLSKTATSTFPQYWQRLCLKGRIRTGESGDEQ
jgi:hypothetical protein